MCCQWLRCAVELNEDDITAMRQWLQEDQGRCHIFDLITFLRFIPELQNIVALSSIMNIASVLEASPPTVGANLFFVCSVNVKLGPHADPLKRWPECVSRDEHETRTVENYNAMKHTKVTSSVTLTRMLLVLIASSMFRR